MFPSRLLPRLCLVFSAVLISQIALVAAADDPSCVDKSGCRPCVDRCRQAGHPHEVSWLAQPSITEHYQGGYIGGGAPLWCGQPRRIDEGTWGVDYVGHMFTRRGWLNWWHGAKSQGGSGAYATDGPHLKLHK